MAFADSCSRGRGAGDVDVLIVGAGPAGIAAALGCLAHGLSVQILEQSVYGGTIALDRPEQSGLRAILTLPAA